MSISITVSIYGFLNGDNVNKFNGLFTQRILYEFQDVPITVQNGPFDVIEFPETYTGNRERFEGVVWGIKSDLLIYEFDITPQ